MSKIASTQDMREQLWITLKAVQSRKVKPNVANTVAGLIRTDMQVIKLEREMERNGVSAPGNKAKR